MRTFSSLLRQSFMVARHTVRRGRSSPTACARTDDTLHVKGVRISRGHVLDLQQLTRSGPASDPPRVFVSLRNVLGALSARPPDPLAIVALGLVLLLITPVLGVAAAVPGFLRDGDRR